MRNTSINSRIRLLRLRLKLTQVQFADKLGLKGGVISAWEKGTANVPPGRLLIICKAYNVREEWLRYGRGEMFEVLPEQEQEQEEEEVEEVEEMELPEIFYYLDHAPQGLIDIGIEYCRAFLMRYDKEFSSLFVAEDDVEDAEYYVSDEEYEESEEEEHEEEEVEEEEDDEFELGD
ncbi:MAG: helix-turn-helix transcriptional regulator [Planctomycetia bacterium]|nr:helix-turn-helix transcriptional regulator [Planctomycetia bacterium]